VNSIVMQWMGTMADGGFQPVFLIGIMLAVLAFMVFAGRGTQNREKKAHEQMLASLSKNDKIVTRGGMIGVVTEVKDDEVVVKVDENTNTKIRMKKWSIAGLLSKESKDTRDSADSTQMPADGKK